LTENASASGYTPLTDGTVEGLIASMDRAGIDRSVVCNIATNPHQMKKVNDFAISCKTNARLIPLGSLHPHAPEAEIIDEIPRLVAEGMPGIKIHPDYMGVEIDDSAFDLIFSICAKENLFVVTHAGYDPIAPDHMHCTPDRVLRVLARHPSLKLVVAHTGGFDCESDVLDKLCGTSVYLDTSLSAIRTQKSKDQGAACAEILRHHDPARILFATDSPWSDPTAEIEFIRGIGLSDDVLEGVFYENGRALIASCSRS
jgi:predicted TIM-barrel fold metal-dependent hydrolase